MQRYNKEGGYLSTFKKEGKYNEFWFGVWSKFSIWSFSSLFDEFTSRKLNIGIRGIEKWFPIEFWGWEKNEDEDIKNTNNTKETYPDKTSENIKNSRNFNNSVNPNSAYNKSSLSKSINLTEDSMSNNINSNINKIIIVIK